MRFVPETRTDTVIIGAGPIGIEMACGLKSAGVEYAHIEAGQIGSTIQWWAPGTRFFSSPERIAIAGVPLTTIDQEKATREDYLAYLRSVVQQFTLRIRSYTRVHRITREDDGAFTIATHSSTHGVGGPQEFSRAEQTPDAEPEGERRWTAQRVILAMGDMHHPRMLNVPGESLPHVSHYFADPHIYFGRRVLIVGGKNSAVEAALRLYRLGCDVVMSYRGEGFDPKRVKYWLRPELEWLISKGKIEFLPGTVVKSINRESITLANAGDASQEKSLRADMVLLLTGYVQDSCLFQQLGLELTGPERRPRVNSATMETSVPNVYVAGTAVGGTQQRARIFIENSHEHVRRIVRAIAGTDLPWPTESEYATLEEA